MRNPFRRPRQVEQLEVADPEEVIVDLAAGDDPYRALGALVLDADWPELPSQLRQETPEESARWIVAFAEIQEAARAVADPAEAGRRFAGLTAGK